MSCPHFSPIFPFFERESERRKNTVGAGRKPNSVPAQGRGGYLSSPLITQGVMRPTRPQRRALSSGADLALLRMGFALPLVSPPER